MKLQSLWTELEEGKPLTRVAEEHGISRQTLRKRLRKDNEEKYNEIMRTS